MTLPPLQSLALYISSVQSQDGDEEPKLFSFHCNVLQISAAHAHMPFFNCLIPKTCITWELIQVPPGVTCTTSLHLFLFPSKVSFPI